MELKSIYFLSVLFLTQLLNGMESPHGRGTKPEELVVDVEYDQFFNEKARVGKQIFSTDKEKKVDLELKDSKKYYYIAKLNRQALESFYVLNNRSEVEYLVDQVILQNDSHVVWYRLSKKLFTVIADATIQNKNYIRLVDPNSCAVKDKKNITL